MERRFALGNGLNKVIVGELCSKNKRVQERGLSFYYDTPLDVFHGEMAQVEIVRIG